jgi:hypothetical protein
MSFSIRKLTGRIGAVVEGIEVRGGVLVGAP